MITLVSLLFITIWSLLTVKLLILACLLLWEITIIISWHAPNKLLVENPFASALYIHSFIQQCYKQRTAWKAFTINPAITENMQCTIVKACTPVIDIEVGVSCLNTVYHIWLWLWLNTGKGSACIPGQCIHYTKINLELIKWLSNKDLKQLSELLFILRLFPFQLFKSLATIPSKE